MIPAGNGEPVVVYRTTVTTDRYGNDTPGPYTAVATYEGCAIAPRRSSEETTAGRQGVIVGLTVYLSSDAAVGPHDRLEVRGDMFEVDGEVGVWRSPFTGWAPGVEVNVRRVEG